MSSNNKYISYLIPSYNHAGYILDCLNSIKDDFVQNSEIIILDDGSTDDTETIVAKWMSENSALDVRFFSQKNQGVSLTLNKLYSLARGQFFRPVASDDMILPGSTLSLVERLKNEEGILCSFADVEVIDTNGNRLCESYLGYLKIDSQKYVENVKKAIISYWAVAGPAYVLRNNFHLTIGVHDPDLLIEDWNMFLKLTAKNKIVFTNIKVAKYRIHGNNTSKTTSKDKRIRNLKSQLGVAEANGKLFTKQYYFLLRAQVYLLKSKIHFLEGDIIYVIFNIAVYSFYAALAVAKTLFSFSFR